ncbi:MAG: NAD-dependent succinate-semialdehyde dehydrogenase [Saprospiraceae bacterium]
MQHIQELPLLRREAYIDGAWRAAKSGRAFPTHNPATGRVIAEVADCGPEETLEAIAAASAALPAWRAKTAAQRARLLMQWHDLILRNADELAAILTAEQGKPLAEAKGEIRYGATFIEWFAEEGKRAYGEVIPPHMPGMRLLTLKQPIGVVGAITPWNFPNAMIARKVAPALAAGCTVVLKPSEETPLSALALAALAHDAGIPAGVLNIVTTNDAPAVGRVLTAHPDVRKISFTGSTPVGKLLMQQCAPGVKKLSLELGGNAPFIVFDDADVDAAVEGAMTSKYRNAGQTCICANRIFVQSGIYEAFVRKFADAVAAQKVGPGHEQGVRIGPLINARALEKVSRLVAEAKAGGARALTGGAPLEGLFYAPTVLADVRPDMRVMQEEIFGPVAPVVRFDTDEDVIRMANDTPYGLAAYFYSRDIGRIFRTAEALEYGMVGVNTGVLGTAVAPFGGVKESGIGREGSKHGLDEFMELKFVALNL